MFWRPISQWKSFNTPLTHACMHMHAHTHARKHKRACTHTRKHTRACTHTRTHAHTHTPGEGVVGAGNETSHRAASTGRVMVRVNPHNHQVLHLEHREWRRGQHAHAHTHTHTHTLLHTLGGGVVASSRSQ